MNVIGIDPSLRRTGWAYVVGSGATSYWAHGSLRGDDYAGLLAVLREAAQAGVTHAAIEDVYLGRNFKTAATLAEVRGRIKGACAAAGIEVKDVPAMTWKAGILTLNGLLPLGRKAQKAAAMMVARTLGSDPRNSDEADAVCIADYGRRKWTTEARAIARKPKRQKRNTVRKTKEKTNDKHRSDYRICSHGLAGGRYQRKPIED